MFEGRLKILMLLWLLLAAAVAGRLVQLQVLRAEHYRRQAQAMLERRPRYFPFVRGQITDRNGRLLAADVPAWDICVQYDVIAADASGPQDTGAGRPIHPCWPAIAEFAGVPIDELLRRADRIRRQVGRIKDEVSARRGVETRVAEEESAHPVVKGLDHDQQVEASLRLADDPNVEINPSHVRACFGGPPVGHLLGRMAEVGPDDLRNDPMADDDLARYRPGDMRGVGGAEALGERVLRGRRGRIHRDVTGRPLSEPVEPVAGETCRLTIDYEVQQALYDRLAQAVEASEFRTGGCAVLLHVPTRQVLAMVDYPSADPAAKPQQREELLKDLARQPLLFRAVREYYPPGSTVKPILMAAALSEGNIAPQAMFNCYGRLFQDYPDRWRCTGVHGMIGPVAALQHSCNVYFYHLAELLGVSGVVNWMTRFGLGRPTGTGLPEELPGRLPEPTASRGAARNLGIGQGDLDVTPLQAANMIATVAAGIYRPVTLWMDDPAPRPAVELPVDRQAWSIVREGLYKAVNEPGGTAYGDHRGSLRDHEFVLLGKTGSAEVVRGRTVQRLYVCHLPDGRVQEIVAPNQAAALDRADCPPADRGKIRVAGYRSHRRYPPDPPEPYTHAWFIGYLAPRGRHLDPADAGQAAVAIAVVIEFTGHGGEVASPVARDMLRLFLERGRGRSLSPTPGGAP